MRMQRVHIILWILRPFSYTDTFCKFALKVRLVVFLDQGRLRPKVVFLPHDVHFAIIFSLKTTIIAVKCRHLLLIRTVKPADQFTQFFAKLVKINEEYYHETERISTLRSLSFGEFVGCTGFKPLFEIRIIQKIYRSQSLTSMV